LERIYTGNTQQVIITYLEKLLKIKVFIVVGFARKLSPARKSG